MSEPNWAIKDTNQTDSHWRMWGWRLQVFMLAGLTAILIYVQLLTGAVEKKGCCQTENRQGAAWFWQQLDCSFCFIPEAPPQEHFLNCSAALFCEKCWYFLTFFPFWLCLEFANWERLWCSSRRSSCSSVSAAGGAKGWSACPRCTLMPSRNCFQTQWIIIGSSDMSQTVFHPPWDLERKLFLKDETQSAVLFSSTCLTIRPQVYWKRVCMYVRCSSNELWGSHLLAAFDKKTFSPADPSVTLLQKRCVKLHRWMISHSSKRIK